MGRGGSDSIHVILSTLFTEERREWSRFHCRHFLSNFSLSTISPNYLYSAWSFGITVLQNSSKKLDTSTDQLSTLNSVPSISISYQDKVHILGPGEVGSALEPPSRRILSDKRYSANHQLLLCITRFVTKTLTI